MEKYKELEGIIENIKYNEPLAKYTTMKVGGPCDVMVFPSNIEEIKNVIKYIKQNNINFYILGNGSNVIALDGGFRGIVVVLKKDFSNYSVDGEYITAEAGVAMPRLCKIAKDNSLSGLEFAAGIPGTCGGCARMNAGAYNSEMSNVIYETTYIDGNGDLHTINNEQHNFSYRHTIFTEHRDYIIVTIKLKLKNGEQSEIKAKMDENNMARRTKQPLEYPSAGSVFKRPEGYFVGKLVDDSGLRGYRHGGAGVSDKHCGFIINVDHATARDVLDIIKEVQDTVNQKFGVMLKTEVEIIGEN